MKYASHSRALFSPKSRKFMQLRNNSILLLLLLLAGFGPVACQQHPTTISDTVHPVDSVVVAAAPTKVDSFRVARISAVGDLMVHSTQYNYARINADSFDFRPCFAEVEPYLAGADFTIGNFETVLAGKRVPYNGYPAFNTPDDFLDALQGAGFDFLVTSNNHSMDQGEKGVLRTLDLLDQYGFAHTGTYRSPADRDSIRVVNLNGIRMAIVNFTYGTNGNSVPKAKPWLVNQIDTALVRQDLAAAAALNPDLVMAFFHFGLENQHVPNAAQKQVVKHAIKHGADIILGAHPHMIQPVEFFKATGGRLDSGFVAWSLGNFISNQYWRYTDAGLILNLEITQNLIQDSIYISEASYLPTWVFRGRHPKKKIHVILPAEKGLQDSSYFYINDTSQNKMKEAFEDTQKYLNKYQKIDLIPLKEEKVKLDQ
ncbi:MAG TPA: CapA family protein [Bacteroidetes bacterium]|nr:CapA family protein [Bacteroidota bacterium]